MSRSFTPQEKENIKAKLIKECEKSWSKFGYKKTSVEELCTSSGISKGAFYLFFESKEALFCETLCTVQNRLYSYSESILKKNPNKEGFVQVLKAIFREYDRCGFLADTHGTDFTVFTNKLTKEQIEKITEAGEKSANILLNKSYLKFKMERKYIISILYTLLSTIAVKDILPNNHIKVFDFLVDNLIDKIIE